MAESPVTSKGAGWGWRHSLWMLWTIISLGWIAFLYVGIRVRRPAWIVWGLVYLTLYIIGTSGTSTFASGVFFVTFVGPIMHAFRIRKKYLALLVQKQAERSRVDMVQRTSTTARPPEKPYLQTQTRQDRPSAKRAAPSQPPSYTASREHSGRSSDTMSPPNTSPQEPLIELNIASEAQLASLPGVGPIIAKRAIRLRDQGRQFSSAEDFGEMLNVSGHNVERIKPLVTVTSSPTKTDQNATGGNSGRVVDF